MAESVVIRPARLGDEMSVARVHVRAWQVGYRKLLPEQYLTGLRAEDRAKHYSFGDANPSRPQTWVAEEPGGSAAILGFATIAAATLDDGTVLGELKALYVDPQYWGSRIGTALESASRAALMKSGCRKAMLWVLAGNARATGFYESRSWRADGTSREAEVWGITLPERRFVRMLDADMNPRSIQKSDANP